jgi:NNP family nitrate/nitrite transporter-like MFS transporter
MALGIAGAGNSGTVLAALFAPSLAIALGWQNVIGLAALPLIVALVVFVLAAKDSPEAPPPKRLSAYLALLRIGDCWWFMFFYSVTFGGFVGLASSLTIYFNDQYGLPPVAAGYCTAAVVFVGSLVRPLGGAVADRVGGVRALMTLYAVATGAFAAIASGLSSIWLALPVFVAGMLALGMGNGSVFQLVPQRFRREIGVMTGLVGMSGGVGGFYLASSLGFSKQITGSYGPGFLVFAALAATALVSITGVGRRWRTSWAELHGAARI